MKNSPLHVCKVQQPDATIYKVHNLIHAIALLALLYYRASSLDVIPTLPWALVTASELLLCFMWLLRQPFRWHPVSRTVFPEGLPEDDKLPAVDVFICTADPTKEPTLEVMNTVVSAMSLDYPPEKLSVYLSDDAGSPLTLYALHEAASFASSWVPFCRKYKIGTICPDAFLSGSASVDGDDDTSLRSMDFISELEKMKSKYELFRERVLRRAKGKFETGLQDRPPLIQKGFLYHSLVEDYFSGFIMHCRGWKSVYYNPSIPAFLGSATISFNESMIQNLRWNSGLLEVGLSRFCPIIYGVSRMSIPQAMAYGLLAFHPLYSFPLMCYATIPQLCLLNGISLYPKVLLCGDSLRTWWNEQRIWMIKSVVPLFLSCLDVFMKMIGIREANFMLTSKVVDEEQDEKYKKGIFDFRGSKLFLIILSTLVTINMVSLVGGLARVISEASYDDMFVQVFLSFAILAFNYPIMEGMIFRKDNGRISVSISIISVIVSIIFLSLGSFLFF
ncbi:hypothetical protein NE237_015766 [Protea cynaroides]|uniref:Cellulose synthase-like protein G2 n=1 Tax=Protea cynaroides TaxID=273540 RepID=A0A9Q0KEN1_9MAGN|nr:hypothetical protein NE237_015766 [Protea cynaroides]